MTIGGVVWGPTRQLRRLLGPSGNCVFDGDGVPSGPNYLLFSDADRPSDSLRDRSGVGWSPRQHPPALGAPQRALDRNLWQIMVQSNGAQRTLLILCTDGSRRACGVGACARLLPTKSDPRETSGPRTDRIPSTWPSWRDRQYRELKKIFFSPPSKCPIDLFGPVSNRTILTQLHVASRSSLRLRASNRNTSWCPASNLPGPSPISNQHARPGLCKAQKPERDSECNDT